MRYAGLAKVPVRAPYWCALFNVVHSVTENVPMSHGPTEEDGDRSNLHRSAPACVAAHICLPTPISLEHFKMLPDCIQKSLVTRDLRRARAEGQFEGLKESTLDTYLEWTFWWTAKDKRRRHEELRELREQRELRELMKLRERFGANGGLGRGVSTV
ncbi:hypothetical protein KIPB_008260 [Kipferlia bialata]|uniref:Uncharacterized protein n=1 Tax=Kipferlia bialata TaxID=797122 RepID=A0A9K3CZQ3_9EUKA|nr:hypothetical protein KIPB_008260 [Kipferlia bialata]|eukprot:g8260.t1